MPIALTQDHEDLAEAVSAFARRHAPVSQTREDAQALAAGVLPGWWAELVAQGLHSVHLPEEAGGAGAGLPELAVIVEALAHGLVPGPFLATALTGCALPDGSELQERLAAGASGAVVHDPAGLTAAPDGEGWRVSGRSGPALGLPGAEIVLVAAEGPEGELWFALDPARAGVAVDEGTDLTRAIGHLELDGLSVSARDVLPTPEGYGLAVAALFAAEASGVIRWCLETAVAHVAVREQFGKPVGAFQAVQHKAAHLLLRAEQASASAWDAARAAAQPAEQQRLAAAQAMVTALPSAVESALECVTLLGAIGYTWDHDVHLYWRRAISLRSLAGVDAEWERRLGAEALGATRDFSLPAADGDEQFRARVAADLDTLAGLAADTSVTPGSQQRIGPRRARLAELGYVASHLPAPHGVGASPSQQLVLAQEMRARGIEAVDMIIGEYALAAILAHGDAEQIERFAAATLRGDLVWCQLFSEPGAGSDLAGLRTRAERVEGGWVIRGQKVWNTMAHEADWGICLVRTDPDAPKHRGISYFLVDMRTPGITVRPLRQSTGDAKFNEVFLDEVFVPDGQLLGAPGEGWRIARTTLATERMNMATARLGHGTAAHLKTVLAAGSCAAPEDDALRVLGRMTAAETALGAMNLRGMFLQLAGRDADVINSVSKVSGALAQRSGSQAILSLLGPVGALASHPGEIVVDHLGLPSILFGGGTVEIQLNILAQRALGLPRG